MNSVAIAPHRSHFYAPYSQGSGLEFAGKSLLTGGPFLLHLLKPAPLWFRLHSLHALAAAPGHTVRLPQNLLSPALQGLRLLFQGTFSPQSKEEAGQNASLESNLQGLQGFLPESAPLPPALPKASRETSAPAEISVALSHPRPSSGLLEQTRIVQSEAKDMMARFCRDQATRLQKKCSAWFFGDRELSAASPQTLRGWLWLAAGGTITGALVFAAAAWLQI